MGQGGVGAGLHQRPEGAPGPRLRDAEVDRHRRLQLSPPHRQVRHHQVRHAVGDRGRLEEVLQLGRRLPRAEALDLGARVNRLGAVGDRPQALPGGEAQVSLLDRHAEARPGAPERVGDQCPGVLPVMPRPHVDALRRRGRSLLLQAGHDERRVRRPHDQGHQPLVGVGVEAGQVGDRDGSGQVGDGCADRLHPLPEAVQGHARVPYPLPPCGGGRGEGDCRHTLTRPGGPGWCRRPRSASRPPRRRPPGTPSAPSRSPIRSSRDRWPGRPRRDRRWCTSPRVRPLPGW